jgi:hypothetical protein
MTASGKHAHSLVPVERLETLILTIRGQKVMLDADLARIYGVTTKRLNEQVKRNRERFPEDFVFRLKPDEVAFLQRTTTIEGNRSQIATGSQRHRDPRFLPYVFTEHGAIMAANVFNSPQAVQMSVYVVRAFIKMRAALTDTRVLAAKLRALERELKARLDVHEGAIVSILQRIMDLIDPPAFPAPPRRKIGFGTGGHK